MALWDALSGKVWHWNSTRLEVHRTVYPRLQTYPPQPHGYRDFIYAGYFAFFTTFGNLVFSELPEIRARNYVGRLKSVNSTGFLNLAASYFCDLVVSLFASCPQEDLRKFGASAIFHACQIYGRDQDYAARWLNAFADIDVNRAGSLLGSEVALVLGLDVTSELDMLPWIAIRKDIQSRAMACVKQPEWNYGVTRELSRAPRLRGYPDSIMK
jgi:hypothetical protein